MKLSYDSVSPSVWYEAKTSRYQQNPALQSIAIDMDEVMADTLGGYLRRYNQDYGTALRPEDVYGKSIVDVVDDDKRAIVRSYVDGDNFFYELEPKPNAIKVIRELNNHYDVYVATAAMEAPNSFTQKYVWLREHFPFLSPINFIFCGDKGVLGVDYLIDDNPKHFARFRGTALLFDAARNQTLDAEGKGWQRVRDWQHVAEILL